MMISYVKGEFSQITGCLTFEPSNLSASHVEASINAATVSTRESQRDRHLRSSDFLDVDLYPTITFRSTKIVSIGENSYEVFGELTIHGITREAVLHVDSVTPEIKVTAYCGGAPARRRGSSARTSASPGMQSSKAAALWWATMWKFR